MYEKWKEKLANKREFKKNDRVCERHFDPEHIIMYWENNINGTIHRTKREKPKLTSTAVPTLNLPTWEEFTSPSPQKKQTEKIKILQHQIIKRPHEEEVRKEPISPIKKLKTDNRTTIVPLTPTPKKTTQIVIPKPVDEDTLELFENLYDEVMDVTLPNTLYGINRCPERDFIVFNKFDVNRMGFSKYLYIHKSLNCKLFIGGKVTASKLAKEQCNTEYISNWLDKIDEQ